MGIFTAKKKIIIIVCAVLALCMLACAGVFVYIRWLAPTLTLTVRGGDESIEVFSHYEDDGAEAFYGGGMFENKPVEVSEKSDIDTNKLGEYTVEYSTSYKDKQLTAYRHVQVVDTTPPVIECPDELTFYEGYEPQVEYAATDNYDGDITESVESERTEGGLVFRVSDSSGNSAQRAVKMNVMEDTEPPVITLLGESEVYVREGQWYEDAGITATDNADGDVSAQAEVQNASVDTGSPGEYTVTYTVTDKAGNTATAQRKVIVYPHLTVSTSTEPANGATVYLTFDDGPCAYTAQLLDILAEYEVKATFFVTAQFKDYLPMIGRAYNEGHAIGVHTLTHDFAIYSSTSDYFADLNAMEAVVKEQTGSYTDIIRFPGGSSNLVSAQYCTGVMTQLTAMVEEQGYTYFDWNVGSNDTGTTDPEVIKQNVISGIQSTGSAVVLMHDIKYATIQAVPGILDWCLENGYSFGVLSSDGPVIHHGVQN